jgi:hypothetical protein
MVCATGTDLDLKISMRIETSRLDWPGAASVGMACLAEWNRHSPASLVSSTATATSASNALSRLANILNNRLPKSFEGCAPPSPQRNSRTQPALAALAAELAAFMRKGVDEAQHSWGPQGASGQACSLHCNLCSSGWAGTITATKTLTSGQPYFGQTATFYVGGTSQIPNRFLAEWTTSGQGKYTDPNYGSVKEWKLNADVRGSAIRCATPPVFRRLRKATSLRSRRSTALSQSIMRISGRKRQQADQPRHSSQLQSKRIK